MTATAEGSHRLSEQLPRDRSVIITVDGPAGTGKSSVSRTLAHRLGLDFLDTGAMYRAAAAIVIDRSLAHDDIDEIVRIVADADLHFDWQADPPTMLAWLEPIDHRIRDADVTRIVSRIASIGPLREHMVRKQRIIAAQHPRLVSEGRDQGSVVFPEAAVKFYLDAAPEIRAERRVTQLGAQGIVRTRDEVLRDILERDRHDSTRRDGPLVCPDDAVRVDTSEMSRDEVVDHLESVARKRLLAS
ncbi:MAG: (d)CMP kinase [Phycisphaerales bacterium]|nr:(d)CMP kinase [Phycisphaerales bacterium]